MDSPMFVEDGQSAPANEREGVELVGSDSAVGEEDDVAPRSQNADCIGADNSDQTDDVREPELHAELSTSGVDDHNTDDVNSETVELTVQVVPEEDSSVCRKPARQRKPPKRYGSWVVG